MPTGGGASGGVPGGGQYHKPATTWNDPKPLSHESAQRVQDAWNKIIGTPSQASKAINAQTIRKLTR